MTRSEFSPACASAGANKSSLVRHQSTLPRVRAAIPAAKRAAAAPSIAPLPPPTVSCNAASGSAPTGRRASTAPTPKGNDGVGAPVLAFDLLYLGAQRLEGGRR